MVLPFQLKIGLSKLALYWERLWRRSLGLLLSGSALLILGLFGIFEILPPALHIALLVGLGLALLWSLLQLLLVKWPSEQQALRWLETADGNTHRPASSLADTLSLDDNDPATVAIWQAHRKRLEPIVKALKPRLPAPKLIRHDPYSLRAAAFFGVFIAVFAAGPDWRERLASIAAPGIKQTRIATSLDAWITPPRYTGKAPIFLNGGLIEKVSDAKNTDTLKISIPENSELVIRLTGAKTPQAEISSLSDSTKTTTSHGFKAIDDQTLELRLTLKGSQAIAIQNDNETLSSWEISIIPDTPPSISLDGKVTVTADQTLIIPYALQDDYGVISATAKFTRNQLLDDDLPAFARKAPNFALNLPGKRIRKLKQSLFQDLTAHPWAGLPVTLTLSAKDDAEQSATSSPENVVLPVRAFTNELARAVVEQRQKLARAMTNRLKVASALDALTLYPEDDVKDTIVFLGLKTAFFRLTRDKNPEMLLDVYNLLWDIALRLEDGDLSLAERELRAAQESLRKALANNASQDEVDKLMEDMKKAMSRFLQAMAKKNRELAKNNPQGENQLNKALQAQDLAKMLETIENLTKSGAREAAQKLLSELQNMLESLQAGTPPGDPSGEQSALSEMIKELGDIINQQQRLMDDTHRNSQDGDPSSDADSKPGPDTQTLADKQQALRDLLNQMKEQFGKNGMKAPSALNQAGKSMKGAEKSLREGSPGRAIGKQGNALDQLRRSAQSMAQQMVDGMARRQGLNRQGKNDGSGKTDPLGRPLPNSGPDFGLATKVPTKADAQRARELQRELQDRASQPGRPKLELDYIDRLLRRF